MCTFHGAQGNIQGFFSLPFILATTLWCWLGWNVVIRLRVSEQASWHWTWVSSVLVLHFKHYTTWSLNSLVTKTVITYFGADWIFWAGAWIWHHKSSAKTRMCFRVQGSIGNFANSKRIVTYWKWGWRLFSSRYVQDQYTKCTCIVTVACCKK